MDSEYRVPPDVCVIKKVLIPNRPNTVVQKVHIHNRVTAIEAEAFRDWTNLKEIIFEDGSKLESIGARAFAGTSLQYFVAPESLKTIGDGAFADCKSLQKVTLNEGLKSISGVGVFQNSGLETICIPSTLREINVNIFLGCTNPVKVEFGTVFEGLV